MNEAEVYIDGLKLTDAQTTTIRVAVSRFLCDLRDPRHRTALGPIAEGYEARGREVERMLVEGGNRPDRLAARRCKNDVKRP